MLIRRLIRNAVAEEPGRGVGGVARTYEVRGVWVAGRRGRSPDLHAFCALLAEELARVEHAAVLPDFEMHVGDSGAAGRAGLGALPAAARQAADLHAQPGIVSVAGADAVAVVEFGTLAVARSARR